jgi:high-affinity nickel permease
LVALALAFVLGLRHASDPDHLVAVTSLVAADGGGPREAARLGAWWGLGHAGTLLGAVVVLLLAALPSQLEAGLALAVFAPMSVVSMAACTAAFSWPLTRRIVDPSTAAADPGAGGVRSPVRPLLRGS